jgi:hypothetical protein
MNCEFWQELAAVSDDLSSSESTALETHLRTCADCRAWQTDLELTRHALRELADEDFGSIAVPIPQVRRINWPALAVAAALIVMLGAAAERWLYEVPAITPTPIAIAPPPPPYIVPHQTTPVLRVPARPRPKRQRLKTDPLLIKIETDDPQVVVYWLVDGNGQ